MVLRDAHHRILTARHPQAVFISRGKLCLCSINEKRYQQLQQNGLSCIVGVYDDAITFKELREDFMAYRSKKEEAQHD